MVTHPTMTATTPHIIKMDTAAHITTMYTTVKAATGGVHPPTQNLHQHGTLLLPMTATPPTTTTHGGQQAPGNLPPCMKPSGPPSMILSGILHGIQLQSMTPNGEPQPTVHGGQQQSTKPNGQPIMSQLQIIRPIGQRITIQPLSIRLIGLLIGLHTGELAPNGNQQHGGQLSGRQQPGIQHTHNPMDGIIIIITITITIRMEMDGIGMGMDGIKNNTGTSTHQHTCTALPLCVIPN